MQVLIEALLCRSEAFEAPYQQLLGVVMLTLLVSRGVETDAISPTLIA